jgi:hypothetical protein
MTAAAAGAASCVIRWCAGAASGLPANRAHAFDGPVFAKLGGRMVKLQPGRVVVGGPGYQIIECTLL